MPIKPTMTHDQFARMISGVFERVGAQTDRLLIKRFQYLGEQLVNHAKDHGTYTDRSSNLRSSLSYVIFQDGKHVDEYFQPGISDEAYKSSREFHQKLGREVPREGTFLFVVAGMGYALKVESKGRDVLASAELLAEKEAPKALLKLFSNQMEAAVDWVRSLNNEINRGS